jgi:hypothetical protein
MKATYWLRAVWQVFGKWSKIATIFRHGKWMGLRNVKFVHGACTQAITFVGRWELKTEKIKKKLIRHNPDIRSEQTKLTHKLFWTVPFQFFSKLPVVLFCTVI